MITLREVLARFGVSFDDRELKKGNKAVDGLAGKLEGLAKTLGLGLIAKAAKDQFFALAEQADHLAKQAAALGLSTTALQEWQHAAGLSGVGAEELTTGIAKLQKATVDAAAGTGPAADAFRRLGVSLKGADGSFKSADQIMTEAGAAIGAMKNPTERTAMAMTLFGRSGAKMIPLFASGADGIAKMRAEVQELGGGFSPDFAKRAEEMNDNISRLNLAWLSFKVRVGGIVIPLVDRFVRKGAGVIAAITKWADATQIFSEKSNLAAAAATVLGLAFFRAGLRAIAPWLPMLALFAGLILLTDEFITLWDGGDTLIGRAIDNIFGEGSAQKAVAWVKGVVKSTKELFTDTEGALTEFDQGLRLMWFDLTTWLGDAWADLGTGITLIFVKIGQDIEYVLAGIKDGFAGMWNSINEGIDKVPGLSKLLGKFSESQRLQTNNRAKVVDDWQTANTYALDQSDARRAENARQRQAIIDSTVAVGRVASAPGTSSTTTVNAPVEVNVTVPPGTPAQQARDVANAAAKGVRDGNKATYNKLVHTAG